MSLIIAAMYSLIVFSLLLLTIQANITGGGFGTQYNWVAWKDAKTVAATQGKPIMLLLHKSWCGACKR